MACYLEPASQYICQLGNSPMGDSGLGIHEHRSLTWSSFLGQQVETRAEMTPDDKRIGVTVHVEWS